MPPNVDIQQLLRARQAAGLELTADQMRMLEEVLPPQQQSLVRAQAGAGQVLGDPSGGTAPAAGDQIHRNEEARMGQPLSARRIQSLYSQPVPSQQQIFLDQASPPVAQLTEMGAGAPPTSSPSATATAPPAAPIQTDAQAPLIDPFSQPADEVPPSIARPEFVTEPQPQDRFSQMQREVQAEDEARARAAEVQARLQPPVGEYGGTPPATTAPTVMEPTGSAEQLARNESGEVRPQAAVAGGTLAGTQFGVSGDNFVISVPNPQTGEPIQVAVPNHIAADPAALRAFLSTAVGRSRVGGNVVRGGADAALPQEVAQQAMLEAQRIFAGPGTPTGGAGGPRYDVRLRTEYEIPGTVDPALAEQLRQAQAATQQAQTQRDMGARAVAAGQALGLNEFGAAQRREAQAAQQRAQEHARQLNSALAQFSEQAERVANREVDPNQIFGGAGGRMGAAVAVALGELGRALTGEGENQALNIINQQIERSMAAQQMNIQNAQRGVANQGQALSMMNSIFQSEEAATQAARALHLQGYAAEIDGAMAGLQGQQLVNAQRLRAAVQREMMLAAQAAQQMEGQTVEQQVRVQGRGAGTVQEAQRALQPAPTRTPQATGGTPQGATSGRRGGLFEAGDEPLVEGADELASLTGIRLSDIGEEAVRLMQQAEGRTGRGAEAVRGAVGSAVAREARRRAQRIHRRPTQVSYDDWREQISALGEDFEAVPQPQAGFRVIQGDSGAFGRYQAALGEASRARDVGNVQNEILAWDRMVPLILEGNAQLGAEVTNAEQLMTTARAARQAIVDAYRIALTGAAAPDVELQRIEDSMPDPGEVSIENAMSLWDAVQNTWRSWYFVRMAQARDRLGQFGLTTDSAISTNVANMRRLATRQ